MAIRFVEQLKGEPTGDAVVLVAGSKEAEKAHYQRTEEGDILVEFEDHHEVSTQQQVHLKLSEGNQPEYTGYVHDGQLYTELSRLEAARAKG